MKKSYSVVLVVLISVVVLGCATGRVPEEERVVRAVVEAAGSPAELYGRANQWMVESFVSAEAVIEYQSREDGIIQGRAKARTPHYLEFLITIETRENRARITFSQLGYAQTGNALADAANYYTEAAHKSFLEWSEEAISDFEEALQVAADDDW